MYHEARTYDGPMAHGATLHKHTGTADDASRRSGTHLYLHFSSKKKFTRLKLTVEVTYCTWTPEFNQVVKISPG